MRRVSLLLFMTAVLAAGAAAEQKAMHQFETSTPADGIFRLEVDIPASDIVIQNGDPDRIDVTGTVERAFRRAKDRKRAQQIVDASGVKLDVQGSRAILRRQFGKGAQGRSAQGGHTVFKIRVKVPHGTNVEIHQKAGDVKVAGSFGDIDIQMRAGDISIKTPKENVRELLATARVGEVTTDLGDRMVSKQGVFPGRTHYLNEGGRGIVSVSLLAGDVDIVLTQ